MTAPVLPQHAPRRAADGAPGGPGHRTEQDRSRSLRRRADPWYRRLGRFVVLAGLLAIAAGGVYAGGRLVQDWLDRDRLPELGTDLPTIRATTFEVTSEAPAPDLDGTITIDSESGAFEYIGRVDGRHRGIHVVSSDGTVLSIRRDGGPWRTAGASDVVARDAALAAASLARSAGVEAILPGLFRRHVELVQQSTEGTGDDELTRYDLLLDTRAMSAENVLEWTEFRRDAIPGAVVAPALPVTIWLDAENVVVRVVDDTSGWRWVRLAHLAEPFVPPEPGA